LTERGESRGVVELVPVDGRFVVWVECSGRVLCDDRASSRLNRVEYGAFASEEVNGLNVYLSELIDAVENVDGVIEDALLRVV
jgi:hypothetical protein